MDAYEELSPEAPFAVHLAAGALAGIAEHTLTYPLDFIKTRMQVLANPSIAAKSTLGKGIRGAVASIRAEEGALQAWRGVSSVVLGAGPAHALYFASYEASRDGLQRVLPLHAASSVGGAVATILADAVMTPFDVVKQRMQVSARSSILATFRSILQAEGIGAFYVSYPTTLALSVPFHGIQFPVYEACTRLFNPAGSYSPGVHVLAGGIAGGIAAAVTTPIDVVKTALQTRGLQSTEDQRLLAGILSAVRFVYSRGGGLRAFARGIQPRVLAYVPSTAICWTTYEYFKWVLK